MQLEQIITMCFFGYGEGQAELQSNLGSYRSRYLNIARHPKLANYQEITICNNGKDEPAVVSTAHPIADKTTKDTDRIGVYLIAHGTGGNSEPGIELIAKLMAEQLAGKKVSKINLAVCQGAIKLNAPQSVYKQVDFDNGTLKKFCDALLKRKDVLAGDLLVSAYAVNVETFDSDSSDTQGKLSAGYAHGDPPSDYKKVHTVRADHNKKQYTKLHPDWSDSGFVASEVSAGAWQEVWAANRVVKYQSLAKKNPSIANVVDKAVSFEKFADMCADKDSKGVIDDFVRRYKSEVDAKCVEFLRQQGSSDFLNKVNLYIRNKMAMRYDGTTFKVCSLSEYTDSHNAKEWLELVTRHMAPKSMSPMSLTYT